MENFAVYVRWEYIERLILSASSGEPKNRSLNPYGDATEGTVSTAWRSVSSSACV